MSRFFFFGVVAVGVFVGIQLVFFKEQVRETLMIDYPVSEKSVFVVPLKPEETSMTFDQRKNVDIAVDQIIGGVVPHHLIAGDFLAEFFTLLQKRSVPPEVILLLAPNHFESGVADIQTANFVWQTAFGDVETDENVLAIVQKGGAVIQPDTFGQEHGIYNILPYIAHFLPGAKIVPIVFRQEVSTDQIESFVASMTPLVQEKKVVVVSSVDFSHYLSKEEAEGKDQETLAAIKKFDLTQIAQYESDHLDSPSALITLLRIGQVLESTKINVLEHGNSADAIRGRNQSTTSHFTFFLSKSQ
ncbi:MAG: AmmeMemoRadiSam system protein B [Candidatus Moranbacteria bacterium]|nr:AmmeMemoRadiSam system protein B [Candidatus Moranbacteria bacterium]